MKISKCGLKYCRHWHNGRMTKACRYCIMRPVIRAAGTAAAKLMNAVMAAPCPMDYKPKRRKNDSGKRKV